MDRGGGGDGDDRPLYYLHVPHSAGTTLSEILERRYRDDELFPGGLLPSLLDLSPEELARFRLFRGHFGLVLPARLGWRLHVITLLRDPLEQALALFGFMRRSPTHYFHGRVNAPGYGVSDFLRDPVCRPLIENHMTRFLAFEPTEAHWAWVAPIDRSDPRYAQAVFELCPMRMDGAELRDRAAATLARLDVVGITERLDDTLVVLARAMGWPPLGPPGHLNATPGRVRFSDLDEADAARLCELKAVDVEVYGMAVHRMATDLQLAARPEG
ncbi:MAG: hypothetical protein M3203_05420 [Actinomycetota bacterium]|nr:hypothetical protein [Actinomycetota bacterium]